MEKIDWSKAPDWADRLMSNIETGEKCWADDVKYQYIDGEVAQEFKYSDFVFALIEYRPDAWQEGEERMNNIAQNGNDGHYADSLTVNIEPIDILDDEPKIDNVNSPEHYQSEDGIECIDAIRAALGKEGFISHCRGTAIKYAWRSGKKANHAEDLRKAAWYLEKAASELDK